MAAVADIHGAVAGAETSLQQTALGGPPLPPPDDVCRNIEGQYLFHYADSRNPGVSIAEMLLVDRVSSSFSWTRTSTASTPSEAPKPVAKKSARNAGGIAELGGRWCSEDVAGVRFLTKRGDPSTEHLTLAQKQLVRRLAFQKWLRDRAIDLTHGILIVVNPLTFCFAVCLLLTGCIWDIFPRVDGTYASSVARQTRTLRLEGWNMMAPPDEGALDWSTCVAAGLLLAALLSLWWVGLLPIANCRCASRLPVSISDRWGVMKPVNAFCLLLLVAWCFFVMAVCPLAKAASTDTQCSPITDDGRRLAPIYSAGDSQCYQQNGVKLRCGVGNCTCGWQKDLACAVPPAQPKEICQTLQRPLCAPDTSSVKTNGYHGQLLAMAFGTSILTFVIFVDCLLNAFAMLQEWFPARNHKVQDAPPEQVNVNVVYHHFTVAFTLPEKNLEFNISGKDDARALAVLLLGGAVPSDILSQTQLPPVPPLGEVAEGSRPISSDSAIKSLFGPASTAAPGEDEDALMPVDC